MSEQPKNEQKPTEVTAEELEVNELDEVAGGDNTACANVLAKCAMSDSPGSA